MNIFSLFFALLFRLFRPARLLSLVFASCLLSVTVAYAGGPYDETANPQQDLIAALHRAKEANQRVLIVFGANWCGDCRALDKEFHNADTAKLIEQHYVVLKVDVGNFDKNLDFAKLYGKPIEKGIPSVVVVTPTNEIVYATRAGELADARHMGTDGIFKFFSEIAERPITN